MGKVPYIIILLIAVPLLLKAQVPWNYSLEGQATISEPNKLPFWFRSGQYGSIPSSGSSAGFIASAYRPFDKENTDGINWSAGFEVRANAGKQSSFKIIEGFVKAKYGIFQASAGRTKEIVGLVDSTLSSGAFSVSGNALGIPKVTIGIPEYVSIPVFAKLFAFKLDYQIGYMGQLNLSDASYVERATTYYQENSIYVRFGKPNWPIKLYGGINHEVQSGNEDKIFGSGWTLSPLKSLIYAAIGKTYSPPTGVVNFDALTSKVGNHIGSIDLGLEYEFESIKLLAYRQSLYDCGAISKLANIADGINGISLTNKNFDKDGIDWNKIVFEFVYTKNQAGEIDSKVTNSGDEDYYNNYVYADGWQYQGLNLGNPLLTTNAYIRAGLPQFPGDSFINNRVVAFHTGFDLNICNTNFIIKATYSKNYGNYGTSAIGHNLAYYKGGLTPPVGLFGMVEEFSGFVQARKNLEQGYSLGATFGVDMGGLYYNTVGLQLSLRKTFY